MQPHPASLSFLRIVNPQARVDRAALTGGKTTQLVDHNLDGTSSSPSTLCLTPLRFAYRHADLGFRQSHDLQLRG